MKNLKKRKKLLAIICAASLLVLIASYIIGNKTKIGQIKDLCVTEDIAVRVNGDLVKFWNYEINCEPIFFDDMTTMIEALRARKIDEISTYESVGNYLVATNQDFEQKMSDPVLIDVFCYAMREEDLALKKEFDAAIAEMNSDGTLTKIVKNFIGESYQSTPPAAKEMTFFYDAPKIKIGFTGDLPPFDLTSADGKPLGFNIAVLAEINKRIRKNFEFVQVEHNARTDALANHDVDVLFWKFVPDNDKSIPQGFNQPDGIIVTNSYFSDEIVHVRLRR